MVLYLPDGQIWAYCEENKNSIANVNTVIANNNCNEAREIRSNVNTIYAKTI